MVDGMTLGKWSGARRLRDGRTVSTWRMLKDHRFHRLFFETRVERSIRDMLLRRHGHSIFVCGIEVSAAIDVDEPIANLILGPDGNPSIDHLDDVPEWAVPSLSRTVRKQPQTSL